MSKTFLNISLFCDAVTVIDLHDAGQFTSFKRSEAYSNVHRRIG
jgi:hypothetical protein